HHDRYGRVLPSLLALHGREAGWRYRLRSASDPGNYLGPFHRRRFPPRFRLALLWSLSDPPTRSRISAVGPAGSYDACLLWTVGNAGFPRVHDATGGSNLWQVVQGAWNEQHNYPIAKDFGQVPDSWWYMGDIPHGWAAAEFLWLFRDILFFEAD